MHAQMILFNIGTIRASPPKLTIRAQYPEKVKSLSFDKLDLVEGTLLGIKRQYLSSTKPCLNIRKHNGYGLR